MRRGRQAMWLGLAALVAAAGCKYQPPKTAPVQGKVVLRGGKILPNVDVQFVPAPGPSGETFLAAGATDATGAFALKTYINELHASVDGAVPGKYKVLVRAAPGGVRLPKRYSSPTDTPLEVDVPEAGSPNLTLEVDPNP